METKEMIETLRYKANNIKAKIEPEFFNEVAERLEKQIAKKVIIPSTDLGKYYHQESCPNCKKEFGVRIAGYKFKDVIGKTNYCHNCGQRIDWSEV
jgi:PHP family Zn ribbon phosphoesterase